MKDLKEIYRAIADGKTLISNKGSRVTINNVNGFMFKNPKDWNVLKEEPKFYRFKKKLKDGIQLTNYYYSRDSENYEHYLKEGWTPMEAKTFDEMM
jgi:hypothetical protein